MLVYDISPAVSAEIVAAVRGYAERFGVTKAEAWDAFHVIASEEFAAEVERDGPNRPTT